MSQDRSELFRNAIEFLSDPKSQSAPMSQRVQFLEAKGLSPVEIEDAMRISYQQPPAGLSNHSRSSPHLPQSQFYNTLPSRQPWDWRDYFILTVVSGSIAYGAISLAKKYLLPHLRPPNSTAYEADRDALTAQFDAVDAMLASIQSETTFIRTAVDAQEQKILEATQEVQQVTTLLKEAEAQTRDDVREVREEVAHIREMLPKMIDKQKESQNQSLGELQQELKSLKALLLSRNPTVGSTPSPSGSSLNLSAGRPSIPPWQLASSGADSSTSTSLGSPSTPHSSDTAA